LHVITIITSNYSLHAQRLIKSLKRQHPESAITVYSEDTSMGSVFTSLGARLKMLPEIVTLGVKRAKFLAYADAAKSGGFIYLDADILVLQPLEDLIDVSKFTACRDDLSECPFILDTHHPWENNPQWTSEKYFNSGVFAVPDGFDSFFSTICKDAMNDNDWTSIIIPGKLYDNHYLCAKIVQHQIEVNFISEYQYNWQGFRRYNELNCYADQDGVLYNKVEKLPLRIVHFAGIKNIDSYIATLPLAISRTLAMAIRDNRIGVLEMLNAAFDNTTGIEESYKLQLIKASNVKSSENIFSPGADQPLLEEAASITSIALSTTATDFTWNGLKCGAAYLAAAEYKTLKDFVLGNSIETILEFGAGYTTVLFKSLVQKQIALEGWVGPWVEFARAKACDARIVPFSPETGFEEGQLQTAIKDIRQAPGKLMVFIDSPQGTQNRSLLTEQVIKLIPDAYYYVVHDSIRDASNVYHLASSLGLMIIGHYQSWRGMTILSKTPENKSTNVKNKLDVELLRLSRFTVSLVEKNSDSESYRLCLQLKNTGNTVLPTSSINSLLFSVHLVGKSDEIIEWDTPRYTLPVDLDPDDTVTFSIYIPSNHAGVVAVDCDFVKEGEFWWSKLTQLPCPRIYLSER